MATYAVKEIFATLQGEGLQVGRPAVFCRFSGCNLWSGRNSDRVHAACRFCDTDFVGTDGDGGGRYTRDALVGAIASAWPAGPDRAHRFCVLTGGEPLLQLDTDLIDGLHEAGFSIAVETNGTIVPPPGIDWLCVSPKGDAKLAATRGDELKLVFPQSDAPPERFEHLPFGAFLLQPMDGPARNDATTAAIRYCLAHPRWRLSTQTHKYLGLR